MSDTVLVSQAAGILTITLNRPEKKNALTGAMYDAIDQALAQAAVNPDVRVVLITGAGDAFTSGNDLQDFATWGQVRTVDELPVIRAIRQVLAFSKPLVAAVKGPAVGFGTTLLLHCDAVIAGHSASFSFPFVKLGLVPEFGSTYLLPAIAGRVRASQHLLLGDSFERDEAMRLGFVSATCDDTELEAQASALCQKFAALPAGTVRTIKGLIKSPEERARLEQAIEAEVRQFVAGLRAPEHKEAVQAFIEKRQPNFTSLT